jgi:hypothetical protein
MLGQELGCSAGGGRRSRRANSPSARCHTRCCEQRLPSWSARSSRGRSPSFGDEPPGTRRGGVRRVCGYLAQLTRSGGLRPSWAYRPERGASGAPICCSTLAVCRSRIGRHSGSHLELIHRSGFPTIVPFDRVEQPTHAYGHSVAYSPLGSPRAGRPGRSVSIIWGGKPPVSSQASWSRRATPTAVPVTVRVTVLPWSGPPHLGRDVHDLGRYRTPSTNKGMTAALGPTRASGLALVLSPVRQPLLPPRHRRAVGRLGPADAPLSGSLHHCGLISTGCPTDPQPVVPPACRVPS